MKKFLIMSLAIVFALAAFTSNSIVNAEITEDPILEDEEFAPGFQDRQRRDSGWRHEKFKEELGLTDEQLQKLGDARITHQKEMVQLQAQIKVVMIDMALLMKDHGNDNAVIEKSRELNAIKSKLAEMQLSHRLQQRAVFTTEQWDKVSAMAKFGKRAGRKGMRHGSGFGQHRGNQSGRNFQGRGRGIGR